MRTSVKLLIVACGVVFGAPAAHAQAAQPPSPGGIQQVGDLDAHTHHGVFLRALIGPAGFDMSNSTGGNSVSVQGGGGGFGLAIGGAISRSLVIYGEVFDDVAVGPSITENGQNLGTAGSNTSAGVIGFGPGLAYFFPSDLYLSATFAASQISIEQNNQQIGKSGTGFGISAMIGKQWWVSDGWGLGIAAQFFGGSIPDSSSSNSSTWATGGAMLAFSATYH